MSCKYHPKYDTASGEPTDTYSELEFTYPSILGRRTGRAQITSSTCTSCWKEYAALLTEKGEMVTSALGVSMIEIHDLKVDLGEFGGHKAKCKVNYHIKGLPCDCGLDKARKRWLKAP